MSLLSACSSVEKSTCVDQDWYEIGRSSGAMGQPQHNLQEEFNSCDEVSRKQATALYLNGRNAGITQYCQASNAFELGKQNQKANNLCPEGMFKEFMSSFKRGQKLYMLTIENAKLKKHLETMEQEKTKSGKRSTILKDLRRAKKQLRKNTKQIKKLSKYQDNISL